MRKARIIKKNATYHVTAQINRGEFALESKLVKKLLILIIDRAKKRYSFKLYNLTIMSNHIHFMIKPAKNENLSRIMQWILSVFAIYFNKTFGYKGHVWYDRFKSRVIESYKQFLATFSYICDNPVKVKLVLDPKEFEYSGIWYIHNKNFTIIEKPSNKLKKALPGYLTD